MQLAFRQATAENLEFLDQMHTICMKEPVMKVYPWHPTLFRQTFNPQTVQIILADHFESP